jgi:uncharacterized pyridoxamine 5'-phosphate oxidase family protein
MAKQEIIEFINKNRIFSLATTEGNQPHVRIMMIYRADENGLLFASTTLKDLYQQLQANPAVELCFFDKKGFSQVRVEGSVELLDDMELKKQIVEDLPFLKPLVESKGYDVIVCYRIKDAKALFWTMEKNFEPKEYIQL